MVKLIEDLRFFIGLFFLIIGALLSLKGAFSPLEIGGINPNLTVGFAYIFFGFAALLIAVRAKQKK